MLITKNQKGITLVEVVVGMTIMLIILSGVAGVLNAAVTTWRYNQGKTSVSAQGKVVMAKLTEVLNQASPGSVVDTSTNSNNFSRVSSITFVGADASNPNASCAITYVQASRKISITYSSSPAKNVDLAVGLVESLQFTKVQDYTKKGNFEREITIQVVLRDPAYSKNNTDSVTFKTNLLLKPETYTIQ